MKKILVFLTLISIVFGGFASFASAATSNFGANALLIGKSINRVSSGTTKSFTDNSDSTNETVGSTTSTQYYYVFATPVYIDQVYIRKTFGTSNIKLTFTDNTTQVFTWAGVSSPTNYYANVTAPGGTYRAVKRFDLYGTSSTVYEVDLKKAPMPPAPPTGLNGVTSDGHVALTWNAAPDAAGYYVYVDGVKVNSTPVTTTSYTAAVANNVVHSIAVSATNSAGESEKSDAISTYFLWDNIPPSKPKGLLAAMTTNQVTFSWIPNLTQEGVSGYNLYQDGVKVNTSLISGTTYSISGSALTVGMAYTFELTAVDQSGNESVKSDPLELIATDTTPPDPPGGVEGEPSDGMVLLTWSASTAADLKGYKIYKNGSFLINTGKITSTIITGLTNGVTYQFGLAAYDNSNNVSPTVTVPVTPVDNVAPDAPLNLSGAAGNKVINLFWSATTAPDLKGYKIYLNGAPWGGLITSIYQPVTGLTNGVQYTIHIVSVDTAGNESAKSNELILTPSISADTTPPSTPTNLTATVSNTTITASWGASTATDLLGYFVYLDGVRANYAPLTSISYAVANLKQGKTYQVQVTAIDNSGNESPLSVAMPVTVPNIKPPTDFKAKQLDNQVQLTWVENEPPPAYYTIYRNGVQIGTNLTGTSFTDPDAEPEQVYSYEILAVDENGLKSTRAYANIYYSLKNPPIDLDSVDLPFSVGGMLDTAGEFLKHYGVWILLGLGVIFAPVLLGIVMALNRDKKRNEKVVSVSGRTYTRGELEDADRAFTEKYGDKYDRTKYSKAKQNRIQKTERAKELKPVTAKEYKPRTARTKTAKNATAAKAAAPPKGGVVDLRSGKGGKKRK